jgi:uncharacterized membrane protein YkvA (DUF1232 family)
MVRQSVKGALRLWASAMRRDVLAVWLAARDPRVPFPIKLLAFAVAAYAFSPIDLIPDFIPVLGYLDDLILVPLGIYLVVRLMPEGLMRELRAQAAQRLDMTRPSSRWAAAAVILVWLAAALAGAWILKDQLGAS